MSRLAVWRVTCRLGTPLGPRETLRFHLPAHACGEAEIAGLLQKLVAAEKGLYADEYAQGLAEAEAGHPHATLRVVADRSGGDLQLMCGDNPVFHAARH